jgi:hypothetical protein
VRAEPAGISKSPDTRPSEGAAQIDAKRGEKMTDQSTLRFIQRSVMHGSGFLFRALQENGGNNAPHARKDMSKHKSLRFCFG